MSKLRKYTQFNPVAFINGEPCQVLFAPYRCPVSACAGYVSFNEESEEDDEFWGCGECGSIWFDKENLLSEIDQIILQFKVSRKVLPQTQKEIGRCTIRFRSRKLRRQSCRKARGRIGSRRTRLGDQQIPTQKRLAQVRKHVLMKAGIHLKSHPHRQSVALDS